MCSTYAVAERDFAQLNQLLRPNAPTIALEGRVAFANNHTVDCLKGNILKTVGRFWLVPEKVPKRCDIWISADRKEFRDIGFKN